MNISETLLFRLNQFFPAQRHPFNLQLHACKSYAAWQFEKGSETLSHYTPQYEVENMLKDKTILDMGCGAGGKSVYYLSCGAKHVTGVDTQESYKSQALAFAEEKGFARNLHFIVGDAGHLALKDSSFDVVIMNDFFEHAADAEQVLREAFRLLVPGGHIFMNFPPYYHPFGAHLSDVINIPWVHVFFSEKTLIHVYKTLVQPLPDGAQRVNFRISTTDDGKEYFSDINKMTIRRFHKILKALSIQPTYLSYTPLRPFLRPLSRLPIFREFFAKSVNCVICKPIPHHLNIPRHAFEKTYS